MSSDDIDNNENNFENNSDEMEKTSVVQSETFKVRIARAGKAPPCLVLLVGPSQFIGKQWVIEDTDRILGRSHLSHIFIDDKSISKSHAKLTLSAGEVHIVDLHSTNKTIVNGNILQPDAPQLLKNNDQIVVGNIIFKFLEKGNIETVSVADTFDRGNRDALTGIANRGAFNQRAEESFRKSELLGVEYSIITFDIDNFKKVNDTHGHPAGDYVLIELSKVIRLKLIRENDFFARTGGEEFCFILLGANQKQTVEIAERVRQVIEAHHFEFQRVQLPITISVGVATKQPGDRKWEDIFSKADKALYESKTQGKNQVQVFES